MDAEQTKTQPGAQTMSAAVGGLRQLLDGKPTLAAARGIPQAALDSIYGVGRELYANGHYPEALRSFEMLCLYDHQDARNWRALGVCRETMEDYAGAAEALTFAVGQLADPEPALQVNLVECLLAAGALDAAADNLRALGQDGALGEPCAGRVRVLQAQVEQLRGGAASTAARTHGAGVDHG